MLMSSLEVFVINGENARDITYHLVLIKNSDNEKPNFIFLISYSMGYIASAANRSSF